jgi:hypothetical protein
VPSYCALILGPAAGLLTGIVLATVFRFWAYRKWVWRG